MRWIKKLKPLFEKTEQPEKQLKQPPTEQNQKIKNLCGKMAIAISTHVNHDPDFQPEKIKFKLNPQKTSIEINQQNATHDYSFTTRQIMDKADEIARETPDPQPEKPSHSEPDKKGCEGTPNNEQNTKKHDPKNRKSSILDKDRL